MKTPPMPRALKSSSCVRISSWVIASFQTQRGTLRKDEGGSAKVLSRAAAASAEGFRQEARPMTIDRRPSPTIAVVFFMVIPLFMKRDRPAQFAGPVNGSIRFPNLWERQGKVKPGRDARE